ncbi:MAG: hypothetical protein M1825_001887 [Sarcosagium campestre]|nr:MAG: hypothetical protein M1825_001887 [Sarcosagium campestre]
MPFLTDDKFDAEPSRPPHPTVRRQSQLSSIAQQAIMSRASGANADTAQAVYDPVADNGPVRSKSLAKRIVDDNKKPLPQPGIRNTSMPSQNLAPRSGAGSSMTDTPITTAPSTAPSSPNIKDSSSSTPRIRPTTLDIPGLTRSKASPDGRIASRDIGSKLVIVMVGLPARGKSYITKKMARYLNWLQHDTRIFNVGERRRVAAHAGNRLSPSPGIAGDQHPELSRTKLTRDTGHQSLREAVSAATILINGEAQMQSPIFEELPPPAHSPSGSNAEHSPTDGNEASSNSLPRPNLEKTADLLQADELLSAENMDQSAEFFDPENVQAAHIREEVALATLDELLDYILEQDGAVGIFDATNSTLERRKTIMDRVRERAGPELGVLFLESLCVDETLLESNMRLKLSGPDYKDQDPVTALEDFKKRVAMYEKKYVPLGEFEEKNNMQYVQMIDVGRKIVSHQIHGFLAAQTVYYLVNFNLSPRQIWITRHGETDDNVTGKIGGNSDLNANGQIYAKALERFISHERKDWAVRQQDKAASTHFPPLPGDSTPPNPEYSAGNTMEKNFCVWTSMLTRSIQTAAHFDEDEYDIKQMKMLDELNAGDMEGMTYAQIRSMYQAEYELRRRDKLHYRYPGAGGEGYLDIINRLRAVIVEVERMTDHVLLVGHRSVARVLLAYFKGLKREDVAHLDVPLGTLYALEPKPYGVDFKAFQFNPATEWFDEMPGYQLQRAVSHR